MRIAIAAVICLLASTASAHLELLAPASRNAAEDLKIGPCGLADSPRGSNVTYFAPGETIEVVFDEYVDHPGHFRIAFDAEGHDFEPPACMLNCDDNREPDPIFEDDPTGLVLRDHIPDREEGGVYRVEVTLPDIECERCTLQVIQVMYDKRPYEPDGNDNYYACADLVLSRAPFDAGTPDVGVSDAGVDTGRDAGRTRDSGTRIEPASGGCNTTGANASSLVLLSLVALRRRGES
ncbi:MAG: SCE4755 family polysaccharide monooxygenase-like protein [Myxococcota bacterium]